MGSVNFIVISYPHGWKIHAGDFPPEIERYTIKNGYAWVTVGNVKHYFSSDNGEVVGLEVNIARKKKDRFKFVEKYDEGALYINGHKAKYVLGKLRRGLIFKELLDVLVISYYCDLTDRYIELIFYSREIKNLYKDFLDTIRDSECH